MLIKKNKEEIFSEIIYKYLNNIFKYYFHFYYIDFIKNEAKRMITSDLKDLEKIKNDWQRRYRP